jgi:hypothetical protein
VHALATFMQNAGPLASVKAVGWVLACKALVPDLDVNTDKGIKLIDVTIHVRNPLAALRMRMGPCDPDLSGCRSSGPRAALEAAERRARSLPSTARSRPTTSRLTSSHYGPWGRGRGGEGGDVVGLGQAEAGGRRQASSVRIFEHGRALPRCRNTGFYGLLTRLDGERNGLALVTAVVEGQAVIADKAAADLIEEAKSCWCSGQTPTGRAYCVLAATSSSDTRR